MSGQFGSETKVSLYRCVKKGLARLLGACEAGVGCVSGRFGGGAVRAACVADINTRCYLVPWGLCRRLILYRYYSILKSKGYSICIPLADKGYQVHGLW